MGKPYLRLPRIIATVVALLPLCLTAAPLPPNGAFPNPGFPKYIESGWAEVTNPEVEGHVSLFYNGQAVDQILKNNNSVFTQMMNITSYECLDSNTYRYIANQATYPEKILTTICVTEYVNATHRLSAVLSNGEQGCPDSPFATGSEADSNGSEQTHFVFLRQDGVLPSPTETTCTNQSNAYIPPIFDIKLRNKTQQTESIADMPYPRTYGSPISQGLWKTANLIGLENQRFYAGARILPNKLNKTAPGNLFAFVGQYLSHDCLSPTEFVSTSVVTRVFNNGMMDYMSACQNGTRIHGQNGIDIVNVEYGQGPNCTMYSIPEPSDAITSENFSFQLIEPLSSNLSTECAFQTEPSSAPAESGGSKARINDFVKVGAVTFFASLVVMLWLG